MCGKREKLISFSADGATLILKDAETTATPTGRLLVAQTVWHYSRVLILHNGEAKDTRHTDRMADMGTDIDADSHQTG